MPNGNKVTVQKELGLRGLIDYMVDERDLANTEGEVDNVGGTPLSCTTTKLQDDSGADDGSAICNPVGGVPPYTYLWDNGETTQTAVGLDEDTHEVVVTDAIEDTTSCNVVIESAVEPLACTITKDSDATFGNSDGSATCNPTGGTAPYTYSWDVSGETTQQAVALSGSPMGVTHTCTVTDANLDTTFCTVDIFEAL